MSDVQEIGEVKPDVDNTAQGTVKNPFKEKHILRFNGKPYLFKPSQERGFSLPVAIHFAAQFAKMIVKREHEKSITEKATVKAVAVDGRTIEQVDEKLLWELNKQAIPDFDKKVFEAMKELVQTDSDFFKENAPEKEAKEVLL